MKPTDILKIAKRKKISLLQLAKEINAPYFSLRRWAIGESRPRLDLWERVEKKLRKL